MVLGLPCSPPVCSWPATTPGPRLAALWSGAVRLVVRASPRPRWCARCRSSSSASASRWPFGRARSTSAPKGSSTPARSRRPGSGCTSPARPAAVAIAGRCSWPRRSPGWAWVAVPVWLKLRFGVLEVISTLLLNFVAESLVSFMVQGPLQERRRIYPQSDPIAEAARLPLLPGTRLHAGLLLALVGGGGRCGISSRARCGASGSAPSAPGPRAAEVSGRIDSAADGRGRAACVSGALAGLAGGVEVSGVSYALFQNLSPGYGFTGDRGGPAGAAAPARRRRDRHSVRCARGRRGRDAAGRRRTRGGGVRGRGGGDRRGAAGRRVAGGRGWPGCARRVEAVAGVTAGSGRRCWSRVSRRRGSGGHAAAARRHRRDRHRTRGRDQPRARRDDAGRRAGRHAGRDARRALDRGRARGASPGMLLARGVRGCRVVGARADQIIAGTAMTLGGGRAHRHDLPPGLRHGRRGARASDARRRCRSRVSRRSRSWGRRSSTSRRRPTSRSLALPVVWWVLFRTRLGPGAPRHRRRRGDGARRRACGPG